MIQRCGEREGGRVGASNKHVHGLSLLQFIRHGLEVVKNNGEAGIGGPASVVIMRARCHSNRVRHLPQCWVEVGSDGKRDPLRGEPLHGAVVHLVRYFRSKVKSLEKFRVEGVWMLVRQISTTSERKFSDDINCHASGSRLMLALIYIYIYMHISLMEWMLLPEGIPDIDRAGLGNTSDL